MPIVCFFTHTPVPHPPASPCPLYCSSIYQMSNSLDLTPSAEVTPHHLPPCPLSHLTSHYSLVWLWYFISSHLPLVSFPSSTLWAQALNIPIYYHIIGLQHEQSMTPILAGLRWRVLGKVETQKVQGCSRCAQFGKRGCGKMIFPCAARHVSHLTSLDHVQNMAVWLHMHPNAANAANVIRLMKSNFK